MFFSKWRVWMTKKSMTNQKGRHQNGGRSGITSAALRHFRPSLEPLEDRTLLSAFLVKDINTDTVSSNPSNLTSVNGTLFFTADDNAHQLGLWKSDGTAAGTTLVKEIFPDSIISDLYNFTNVGGTLFFATRDQSSQVSELWKSDGTPAGTGVVKSFGTGFIASPNGRPAAISFNGELFFFAKDDRSHPEQLWKSDGSSAGTVPVDAGAFSVFFPQLTVVNNILYFEAADATHPNGGEVWQTDGSNAGTQPLDPNLPVLSTFSLANVNGALYFFAIDPAGQSANLYRSDGTAAGTTLVFGPLSPFFLNAVVGVNGTVFFTGAPANDPFTPGLWVIDGTGPHELQPANVGSFGLDPFNLTTVNGHLVFEGFTNSGFGEGPWVSDGTDAGTMPLPINNAFATIFPSEVAQLGNFLLFSAGFIDQELWKTDGTVAGTSLVKDIAGSAGTGGRPSYLTVVNGALFFNAFDELHGAELWKSDGTTAGTALLKDINTNTVGSDPFFLTAVNNKVLFTANSQTQFTFNLPQEIWQSDGTAAGTNLVATPTFPLPFEDSPVNFTNVNGTVFFAGSQSAQLWKTDGTAAGTVLVKDFAQTSFGDSIFNLTAVGSELFFTFYNGSTGEEELWQSDGTPAGTSLVQSNLFIFAGSGLAVGHEFFFINADPNTFAEQLWESDGTAAGTHVVDPANPGANVFGFTNVNGTLYYFDQGANFNDLQLWNTDGTTATLVADVQPGADFAFAFPPINVNGTVDFLVQDFSTGTSELWSSDGTAADTKPVAIVPQPDFTFSSSSGNAVLDAAVVGNRLLFAANAPIVGDDLWVSDGTAGGTKPVANVTAGTDQFGDRIPFNLTAFNGRAFFTASDSSHGTELWESDATAAGTFLVQDINPGPAGSAPSQLTPVGGTLFFTADDGTHGNELWAYYPATHFQVTTASNLATPGSPFPMAVTALDRNGNVDTAYTGTVHFTSTDGSAVLPADYTFTPGDHGVHTFTVTLKTPGVQTITATDTVTGSIRGLITLNVPTNVSNKVRAVHTPFVFNRFDGFYDGLIAIQNISGTPINGPIQIVLTGLDPRIKLARAFLNGIPLSISRTASGDTVITLNVSQLARGAILGIVVEFSDPFALPINFGIQTFSDTF